MNKGLKILLGALVVAGLGYWAFTLMESADGSDKELLDFAIQDVETVDRIIITDQKNYAFEVVKGSNGKWTDKDGNCIMQTNVEFILEAFQNIRFKGYLPDNAIDKSKKMMAGQNIKVEIFQDGDWTKTWYLGESSQDQYGQIMTLETKRDGVSSKPVIMKLKGHMGIIDPMFYSDPRKWECTEVFAHQLDEIQKVDIVYNDEPERSFSVTKNGTNFDVRQQGKPLLVKDTSSIFRYLQNYQKIHYNLANYELGDRQVDSLLKTTPFATIELTTTDNATKKVKCFRIFEIITTSEGNKIPQIQPDKFWCELPGGKIVKSQYFAFNPILMGQYYFPMDLSMLKTEDGIMPK